MYCWVAPYKSCSVPPTFHAYFTGLSISYWELKIAAVVPIFVGEKQNMHEMRFSIIDKARKFIITATMDMR